MCAKELLLPKDPHICNPLRPKTVFEIDLDEFDNLRIMCCVNPLLKHPCTLTYEEKVIAENLISLSTKIDLHIA